MTLARLPLRPCSFKGCDGYILARELCQKHYNRWMTHGDASVTLTRKGEPSEYRIVGEIGFIKVSDGTEVIVDADRAEELARVRWSCHNGYSHRVVKGKTIHLSHLILGNVPSGYVVDHVNGNPRDNRKGNLRACTTQQNVRNRGKCKKSTASQYIGVTFDKSARGKKWAASIHCDGRRYGLGRYRSQEDAAVAYNSAAKKMFGEFARLNQV